MRWQAEGKVGAMSNATRKQPKRLVAALAAALGMIGLQSGAFASVLSVTSCADDGSEGSLRQVAAQAIHGDTIDLSGLSCVSSTVTLTQGEIVLPYNVTLNGPASADLTVSASGSRVFTSTSQDKPAPYLAIQNLKISGGRVNGGYADATGGCVQAAGQVTLSNSSVSDCSANSDTGSSRGGAIYAESVSLVSSRVSSSAVNAPAPGQVARGGGIYVRNGSLYCRDSTISGNVATAESESDRAEGGGVLAMNSDVHLYRCTVDSNAADSAGGVGQVAFYDGVQQTLIENSTISGNSSRSLIAAAGFNLTCSKCSPSPVQLYNSTVAFNTGLSNYVAGIYTNGAILAQSSIVANNVGAGSVEMDTFSHRLGGVGNLVMSSNVVPEAGTVVSSADPQLAPLSDNGGATRTHALTAQSPALGAGNNSLNYVTDQRGDGFARAVAGSVDIGAFQSQAATPALAVGDAIFSGSFND